MDVALAGGCWGSSRLRCAYLGNTQVVAFHAAAFAAGYGVAVLTVAKETVGRARCLSLETGMQVPSPKRRDFQNHVVSL